jgi:ABC-type amino acid transport substrate-binding protein
LIACLRAPPELVSLPVDVIVRTRSLRGAADPPYRSGRPHRGPGGRARWLLELFGSDRVRAIHDLRGKTVGAPALDSSRHVFLASLVAHVGLCLQKDIGVVTQSGSESVQLLKAGKIDGYVVPTRAARVQSKADRARRRQQQGTASSSGSIPWPPNGLCADRQGDEHLRAGVDTGRTIPRGQQLHEQLRLRAEHAHAAAMRAMARFRCGGHHPLQRAAPPPTKPE